MQTKPEQVLVVGGSGMLSGLSIWLANQGYEMVVVVRNRNRLDKLANKSKHIKPLQADYSDLEGFRSKISAYINSTNHFSIIVAWIHRDEAGILKILESINGDAFITFCQVFNK